MEQQTTIKNDGRLSFFRLVKAMREAQREYFSTRSRDALTKSLALEKRVDNCIAHGDAYLNKNLSTQTRFQE